jgi:outer membrane protein assembly factor BamB
VGGPDGLRRHVLGFEYTGHGVRVKAVSAATGAPAWTMTLPTSLPQGLGLVPAGKVVVVEAGHDDPDSVAEVSVVTEYIAVDLSTGHRLWTAPASAADGEVPPIAAAGDLLLTGDLTGG